MSVLFEMAGTVEFAQAQLIPTSPARSFEPNIGNEQGIARGYGPAKMDAEGRIVHLSVPGAKQTGPVRSWKLEFLLEFLLFGFGRVRKQGRVARKVVLV